MASSISATLSTQLVTKLPINSQLTSRSTGAQRTADAHSPGGPVRRNEIRTIVIVVIVLVFVFIGSILLALFVWRRQEKRMAKQRGFELDAESTEVVLPKKTTDELETNSAELEGPRHYFELAADENRRTTETKLGSG
jgi:flagellar biosynthesis/type III secretory pathway M-ring protein FliF/YscJ